MTLPKGGTRTLRVRRLAQVLRGLRDAAGLTTFEVNDRTGLSLSSLTRIEHGETVPRKVSLRALLETYGVPHHDPRWAEIMRLADSARAASAWLHGPAKGLDISDEYRELIALEGDAIGLETFEALVIPGLLQTEAYARAVVLGILAFESVSSDDVSRRVALRRQRQAVLAREEPVHLAAVINEAAMWCVVGSPSIMAEQMRALTHLPENVHLQVLPYRAGANPGMLGSFVVMQFRDAVDLVYVDSVAGELLREAPEDVERYRATFRRLQELALSPAESTALIVRAEQQHEGEG